MLKRRSVFAFLAALLLIITVVAGLFTATGPPVMSSPAIVPGVSLVTVAVPPQPAPAAVSAAALPAAGALLGTLLLLAAAHKRKLQSCWNTITDLLYKLQHSM
jgi:hypothetical protein